MNKLLLKEFENEVRSNKWYKLIVILGMATSTLMALSAIAIQQY